MRAGDQKLRYDLEWPNSRLNYVRQEFMYKLIHSKCKYHGVCTVSSEVYANSFMDILKSD